MSSRFTPCFFSVAVIVLAGGCVDGDLTHRYDGTVSAEDRGTRVNALGPKISKDAADRAYHQVAENDWLEAAQSESDRKRSESRDQFLKDLDDAGH